MSTKTIKGDKSLKIPSDSISEGITKFSVGHAPRPFSVDIFYICMCASHTMRVHAYPN